MKIRYIASFIFLACIANSCLEDVFSGSENQTPGFNVSDVITGAATVDGELVPYGKPMPTKALIDKETTRNLDSYFLRMDEDIASNGLDGLYTFKGTSSDISLDNYYPNSYLLMAQTIASPDNETERFRSITFSPSQSYKTRMVRRGTTDVFDTTHFYHTRMVGFYPREKFLPTSEFPTNPEGGLANVQLSNFSSQGRYKMVGEQTWIKFTGLSAGDDLMVTDLKEAQQWHDPSPTLSPGAAKDNGHYAQPYGFNRALPSYKNYFTFHHLRSAVRVSVMASSPEQNMTIWGKIKGVTIQNQPADCWVKLPEILNGYPGSSDVEWISESRSSVQLIEDEAIFGNDSNHSNLSELPPYDSKHEISLDGLAYNVGKKIYLGYSCIVPGEDLTLELHTTSGIYTVTIPHTYNAEEVFRPSYFYNVVLDLKTEGTVSAILENEENEYYYDLTSYRTLDSQSGVKENGFSNCYIVDPTSTEITTSLASLNAKLTSQGQTNISHYSGYAFCATNIGNGQAGILSYGAQTLYPGSAIIEPVDARLIWETSHGLIRDVVLLHDYVRFKLSPEAAAGTVHGNAVIGVYDKQGNVLWSWHIWVGETPSEVNVGGNIFMDRNLGATAALTSTSQDKLEAFGLYYQWGRKDPSMYPPTTSFSTRSMNTAPFYDYDSERHAANERKNYASPTVENSIRYPQYLILPTLSTGGGYYYNWLYENNTLLWGYNAQENSMHKSIYDPCPLGWRVPGHELENAVMSASVTAGTKAHKVGNMYLPYVGFKGDDYDSNSLNFEWRFVGEVGDYQTAVVNPDGHRQRIMVSKNATFSVMVGNTNHYYSLNTNHTGEHDVDIQSSIANTWIGGTNRRTAAVIRCVKDDQAGSITARLNKVSGEVYLKPDDNHSWRVDVDSYASALTRVKLEIIYTDRDGNNVTSLIHSWDNPGIALHEVFEYSVPSTIGIIPAGTTYRIKLTATNRRGTEEERYLDYAPYYSFKIKSAVFYGTYYDAKNHLNVEQNVEMKAMFTKTANAEIRAARIAGVNASSITVNSDNVVVASTYKPSFEKNHSVTLELDIWLDGVFKETQSITLKKDVYKTYYYLYFNYGDNNENNINNTNSGYLYQDSGENRLRCSAGKGDSAKWYLELDGRIRNRNSQKYLGFLDSDNGVNDRQSYIRFVDYEKAFVFERTQNNVQKGGVNTYSFMVSSAQNGSGANRYLNRWGGATYTYVGLYTANGNTDVGSCISIAEAGEDAPQ